MVDVFLVAVTLPRGYIHLQYWAIGIAKIRVAPLIELERTMHCIQSFPEPFGALPENVQALFQGQSWGKLKACGNVEPGIAG